MARPLFFRSPTVQTTIVSSNFDLGVIKFRLIDCFNLAAVVLNFRRV